MDSLSAFNELLTRHSNTLKLTSQLKSPAPYNSELYKDVTSPLTVDKKQFATVQTLSAEELNLPELSLNELLARDKQLAEKMIDDLIAAADEVQKEQLAPYATTHDHPYFQTLERFLGPNYTIPNIEDLPLPDNYEPGEYLGKIEAVANKLSQDFETQIVKMSAEAMDSSFPGITSENLGNAFGVLNVKADGSHVYDLDEERLKNHLILAEIFRNTPSEYFVEKPMEAAQRLLKFYTDINQSYIERSKCC